MGSGAGELNGMGMLSHELLGTDCYDWASSWARVQTVELKLNCKSQQGTWIPHLVARQACGDLILHRGFPFVCAICAPHLHPHRSALLYKATKGAYLK